jgi:hypothetical protein
MLMYLRYIESVRCNSDKIDSDLDNSSSDESDDSSVTDAYSDENGFFPDGSSDNFINNLDDGCDGDDLEGNNSSGNNSDDSGNCGN